MRTQEGKEREVFDAENGVFRGDRRNSVEDAIPVRNVVDRLDIEDVELLVQLGEIMGALKEVFGAFMEPLLV